MSTKAILKDAFDNLILDDSGMSDDDKYVILDAAYRYLYSLITEMDKGFYETYEDLSLTDGTALYSLTNDYLRITNIENITNQSATENPVLLNYIADNVVHKLTYSREDEPKAWFFQGNQIRFVPIPDASYTARVYYIPQPTMIKDMVDGDTLVRPFNVWYMAVALRAAKMFRGRNTEEWNQLQQMENEEVKQMLIEVSSRQTQRPPTWNVIERMDDDNED